MVLSLKIIADIWQLKNWKICMAVHFYHLKQEHTIFRLSKKEEYKSRITLKQIWTDFESLINVEIS